METKESTAHKIVNQETNGPITMASHGKELLMVYGDSSNTSIWVTTSADGINWSRPYQIPNQQLNDYAAISDNGHLVYKDANSSKLWYTQISSAKASQPFKIPHQYSTGPILVADSQQFDGNIDLVYQDDSSRETWYTNGLDGSWSPATKIMYGQQMGDYAAMVKLDSELIIVYKDNRSSRMWVTKYSPARDRSSTPAVIVDQFTKGPICLAVFNKKLYLVYKDNLDGDIWLTTSADAETWTKAERIESQQIGYAAALAEVKGSLWLTYKDNRSTQLWATKIA
jgi:hypothetical protein